MNVLSLPVALAFAGAALAAALIPFPRFQRWAGLATLLAVGAATAVIACRTADGTMLALHFGNWPAGIAIAFVADRLAAFMLAASAVTMTACYVYALGHPAAKDISPAFTPLYLVMLAGVNGCFLTGDFFNLFVFFEVMLISSYGLLVLRADKAQLRGTLAYVVLNLMASTVLLVSVGLLYGHLGTVNMAFVAERLAALGGTYPPMLEAALMFILGVFAVKAAAFPLCFWLPEAYPRAWAPVSAAMGGLLTKVGVYCLFRSVPLFYPDGGWAQEALLYVAGATMLVGVLGAVAQDSFRRVLSFHIISQVGYMIFGVALFSPLAVAGGIFHIVHNALVKTALFLVGGAVEARFGTGAFKRISGAARTMPLMGAAFLLAALSIAGIPPLSGFYGKLALLLDAFGQGAYVLAGVSLVTGLFTLMSMVKIWDGVFWGPFPKGHAHGKKERGRPGGAMLGAGVAILVVASLAVAAFSGPIFAYAREAAEQILDVSQYVRGVLGDGGAP